MLERYHNPGSGEILNSRASTESQQASRKRDGRWYLRSHAPAAPLAFAIALTGCSAFTQATPVPKCPPVIVRAIEARGGELHSFRRIAQSRVYMGFPGDWRFEYLFHVPHFYRWTVFTSDQPDRYSWDGEVMRAAVGDNVIGTDTSGTAPLRSHARWNAVTHLDTLCEKPFPALILPIRPKTSRSEDVLVRFEDRDEYVLRFDTNDRLVRVVGPIEMEPFGTGELVGEFSDFRSINGFFVPTRTRYHFAGHLLSEETTVSFTPNDVTIVPKLFRFQP